MVRASHPVASFSRLAARPVGAARSTRADARSKIFSTALTMVVLPVPGPPVMTITLWSRAACRAWVWLSESRSSRCACTQATARPASRRRSPRGTSSRAFSRRAIVVSQTW